MTGLAIFTQLALEFILGTIVLWICSFTVDTPNANLKTAATYNVITTALGGILIGIGLIFLHSESAAGGGIFIVLTGVILVISFWLLMRMYVISFLAALWLCIAVWAVSAGVEKLVDIMF